ncbi:SEC-C domain-containing protein, partial [Patescibacteria group bacterium]|nr:SEC-C domain-containing protein [Patescibacteria group bacterium]
RWADGLHQAVEAREGVHIQKESRTVASITFQNYFKMYEKLSGMTGTALTSAEEFYKVYKLETISIPTNKPLVRKDLPDLIFQTEKGKFTAIIKKIRELNQKGQPVLVGTASIERNEYFSALLKKEGIQYQILNAKNHEEEGQIIAQAGKKGKVTIATNMAGRGVDIVLGGNPLSSEDAEQVCKSGGLFVLGTERHEARRIDNQLRGRSGRQGDPGETQFFVSLEDELMRVFGPERIKNMMGRFGIPEDQPIENKMITRAIESAQGKIEGFNFDARKHVLEYDDVLNHQRNIIYKRRKNILWSDHNFIKESLGELFSNAQGFYPEEEINKFKTEAQKRREEFGDEKFYQGIRILMLQATDMHWMQHLEVLDYLRSSVRLRAYGQRDPLVEYKNEAIRMFRELENSINNTIINMAGRMGMQANPKPQVSNPKQNENSSNKVGRNDPCPCGSGKKFKKCCMNK